MSRRLLLALAISACTATTPRQPTPPPSAPLPPVLAAVSASSASSTAAVAKAPDPDAPALERCGPTPSAVGRILDPRLIEVSGVAESQRNPGVLYVHNDSGDSARFFAIDRAGALLAELRLSTVPLLIDAEDIALGPGPGGVAFIYLGDTGNNFASFGNGIPRRKAVIYRIPEPALAANQRGATLNLAEAFPIVFTFPDGARDVEAFFIDPLDGALYMISKHPNGRSQLLTASAAVLAAGGGRLSAALELRFGAAPLAGSPMPTSAAISRDGHTILVRTYSSVFAFTRASGQSVPDALRGRPTVLPSAVEAQGEAITFVDQDRAFVTISEGLQPSLNCTAPSTLNAK